MNKVQQMSESTGGRWGRQVGRWALAGWLGLASQVALAATQPSAWTVLRDPGGLNESCAGCHGAYPGPSSDLRAALASPAALRTYVNGLGMNAVMNGLTLVDAQAIQPYLIKQIYGEFTSPAFDSSTPPTYSKSLGSVVVGGAAGTATLTMANGQATSVTYSLTGIGTTAASEFWYNGATCSSGSPPTIPAGGTCSVTLRFNPTTTGARNDSLSVTIDGLTQTIALSGTGLAPAFSIGSATLNINATVGNNNNASTTITNSGTSTLSLTALSFSGAASAEYALGGSNTCTSVTSLGAGNSCTLQVQFTPSVAGARNASLNITHNATGSPQVVTLNGTAIPAPEPSILASASSLSFVDTQLGSTSQQSVTVENNGTAALTFSSIAVSGAHAADFVRGGTCSTGSPLGIGITCTVTVTFGPAALGARTASLAINSNASNGNLTLPLSGQGVPVPAPVVSLSTATLAFGNQTLGGLYQARTVTLTNTGTAALAITSFGVPAGVFAVESTTCGASLAVSASCNVLVRFTPAVAGVDVAASLTLVSNEAGSPHTVSLTGRGTTAAAPVLVWSPLISTLDYGNVAVGSPSAVQTATVSNQGPGGATISLINIVGVDAAQFSVSPACAAGQVIYEGETCVLSLQFTPGLPGARTAQVQFASSGSPPTTLTLSGTGMGGPTPLLSWSQPSLAFGQVRVGASATPQEIALTSSGSSPLQVTAMAATGPYSVTNKTCPAMPFELPSGSSCVVTVTFLPTAEGSSQGALTLTSNAGGVVVPVTLEGQGQAATETSSGGGCTTANGPAHRDPTLWLLAVAAGSMLWRRRSVAARAGQASFSEFKP